MLWPIIVAALRALLRACGPEPRQDGVPTPGGEDDVAAAIPNPPEPVGQGDVPRPPTDDLVCAPAAYVQPTVIPYVNPSKVIRRCARCHVSYIADAPKEQLDLYWVGNELLCEPCAEHEGNDVTLERVVRA